MPTELQETALRRLSDALADEFDGVLPRRRVERVVARCADDLQRVAESRFATAAGADLSGVLAEMARHQLDRLARATSRV